MSARANISPGYRWRLGIIGLVCLGFAALCFKDGYWTYPQQRDMGLERDRLAELHPNDAPAVKREWLESAERNGWPTAWIEDKYNVATKGVWDVRVQWIMFGITFPVGMLFAVSFVRAGGRWIELEGEDLRTSWGQKTSLGGIDRLDKTRWRTKGIAVVRYDDAGQTRRLVLDDWKFERAPISQIIEAVQQRLSPDQIVGDEPANHEAPDDESSETPSS